MRGTSRANNSIEIPIHGMDCAGCARTVQQALSNLPGVRHVEVLLAGEKAVIEVEEPSPSIEAIRAAVERAGYRVPEETGGRGVPEETLRRGVPDPSRRVIRLFGVIFASVLFVVVAGEVLGLFDWLAALVPWPVGLLIVLAMGYPVFSPVVKAAVHGRVIAHTLMAVGAVAALVIGEWVTAAFVVFFMRMGAYAERYTTETARDSLRSLTRMAPQTARVLREDGEHTVPVDKVETGVVVQVRPGERIPVDGEVLEGRATVDQSAITGESIPVEVVPGRHVYAATIAEHGTLKIRASAAGRDSTFSRVIRMVEEAERHKGTVQRYADRFSTYYLPIVASIAIATFALGPGLMAAVAVLVVACSCAFALATPAALLASIGAAAKKGLLVKGGKYLELLARADVVLLDKTGTITLGKPEITDVISLNGYSEEELIRLAAAAEKHSEHPLADAVRRLAEARGIPLEEPSDFESFPGVGVRAIVGGHAVSVGSRRFASADVTYPTISEDRSLLYVLVNGEAAGVLAAADVERGEVKQVLSELSTLGIRHIELLTGDHEHIASSLAGRLGIRYRAELLPEDKIEVVREYQRQGRTVVMIGDGVNDAPALAQADVGIAMAAGSDVAIEASHIALMRDDWRLIPLLFRITRRTMGVVRLNLAFTAVYNVIGLALAATGILPPIYAAAAQSLPDVAIMANSARLIRQ